MVKILAKDLKLKRKRLLMNVEELAKIFGTAPHNIYKWEGKTKPTTGEIYKKIEKFIAGFYDSAVHNGVVDEKKLAELEAIDKQNSVKNEGTPFALNQPPLTISLDYATSTIAAQNRTIELLENELERLRLENKTLKEKAGE